MEGRAMSQRPFDARRGGAHVLLHRNPFAAFVFLPDDRETRRGACPPRHSRHAAAEQPISRGRRRSSLQKVHAALSGRSMEQHGRRLGEAVRVVSVLFEMLAADRRRGREATNRKARSRAGSPAKADSGAVSNAKSSPPGAILSVPPSSSSMTKRCPAESAAHQTALATASAAPGVMRFVIPHVGLPGFPQHRSARRAASTIPSRGGSRCRRGIPRRRRARSLSSSLF